MATLSGLHYDVLSQILLLIHDTSRHTVFWLLLVNRALHDAVLPFVYRECTFKFDNLFLYQIEQGGQEPIVATQERLRRLNSLEPTAYILQAIRKLTISSSYLGDSLAPSKEQVVSKWSPLIKLISHLKHLAEIIFDCREPIPRILLEALQNHHPTTRLHVRDWSRLRSDVKVGDPDEEALARCQCLRSISAHFTTRDYNLPALQRVATLAPNLESLEFERGWGFSFGGASPDGQRQTAEEGAKFLVANISPRRLKSLRWDKMDILHWQTFLDLQELETLNCGTVTPEDLSYAMDHQVFRRLRQLSLSLSTSQHERISPVLFQFLVTCPPLESLAITNYSSNLPISPICLHHGPFLQSLALHTIEDIDFTRKTLSLEDLQQLCSMAPLLHSLEIDINRTASGHDEESAYALLSTFLNLSSITIHYDLGIHRETIPGGATTYPLLGTDFAQGVWHYIEKGKLAAHSTAKLTGLTLYIGEPNQNSGTGLWVHQARERRQNFHVTRYERDDMHDKLEIQGSTSVGPNLESYPVSLAELEQQNELDSDDEL